jgi:hypothetical protein
MSHHQYIPGVCNIGKAEIRKRYLIGWIGTIAAVVLGGVLIGLQTAPAWRLFLFFPATVATIGFLQYAWRFCARFGLVGVFNFGPNVSSTDTVEQAEFRRQDRRKALQIVGLSLLVGGVTAVAAYFIPW